MTLVVSWISVDTHGPSAIYLASDSRISWGVKDPYDYGRKVFGCVNSPDIFAYCGDVLFPSIVLNQLVALADLGMLFGPDSTAEEKFQAFFNKLAALFAHYPHADPTRMAKDFEIIHASRNPDSTFFVRSMKWTRAHSKWKATVITLNKGSDQVHIAGSGDKEFIAQYEKQWSGINAKTSRGVFHAFVDTLVNMKHPECGGAPQLVGLWRGKDNAKFYGVTYGDKRYLHGLPVDNLLNYNVVDWRNELFEVCDGFTMKRKDKAQQQPNAVRR